MIQQVTAGDQPSNATYFLQQSFLPGDREVMVVSYATGVPQLYIIALGTGDTKQLTDGPVGIHPFSPAQHPKSSEIAFTRRDSLCAVSRRTGYERVIARYEGASIGESSISADGRWLTAAFRKGEERGILVASWDGIDVSRIPFPRTVIHPQFHPLDPDWIEFAGDPAPRMHRVRRDGTGLECLYEHSNDEFVVHETFLGQTGDLVFTVWPRLVCRMDWTTREIKTITEFNAWHIAPDRAGARILCDTNHPDLGIHIISVADGGRTFVCRSDSSNRGSQWRTSRYALKADFEAAREAPGGALSWMEADADTVYGPQCTHPHPSWSRDERRVIFTSDMSGTPQVYVADIE
jgi:hypothetical protein